MTNNETLPTVPAGKFLKFDYMTFWVGNAKQAAQWYVSRFGFRPFAYRGMETGEREVVTHVIKQNDIVLAFSSPLQPGNETFGKHMTQHGDGVRDVSFTVDDSRAIYETAVKRGAVSVLEPVELKDEHGVVVMSSIQTYGDTVHTFIERTNYNGEFLPGFRVYSEEEAKKMDPFVNFTESTLLLEIDHCVGNQGWNMMNDVCQWYEDKLGFHRFWSVDDKQVHTEFSALSSIVMADADENVKMPINEPAKGKKKSQVEEYVEYYGGVGVQHIALRTDNIIESIQRLQARGLEFLTIPDSYYVNLRKRLSTSSVVVAEDLDTIQRLKILVDFDEHGYLLQIFTKPVEDRPTVFFEVIQRANNNGFGVGNFKALFQAIELEQEKRGTLTDSVDQ